MAITSGINPQPQINPNSNFQPTNNNFQNINTNQQTVNQRQSGVSLSVSRMFGSPISSSTGSEYTNNVKNALYKIFESTSSDFNITLLTLDNTTIQGLSFSCIVICAELKVMPDAISAYTLILEATGDRPSPYMKNINGQQIPVERVTADAYNIHLIKYIRDSLKTKYPVANLKLVNGCVIPKEFDITNSRQLQLIAYNAGTACGSELELLHTNEDLKLDKPKIDLEIDLDISDFSYTDIVGNPIRCDGFILLKEQSTAGMNRDNELNISGQMDIISKLGVYVDLVYAPSDIVNAWQQVSVQRKTQSYAGILILTSIENTRAYTPAVVLLSLITALSLRNDNNWYQFFKPKALLPGEINYKDIGILNVDCNITNDPTGGKIIDTSGADFSLNDLGQLMQAMFHYGLAICIDIPRVGTTTWFTDVFDVADSNDQHANNAYQIIWNAANTLTMGIFSNFFTVGLPIFVNSGNIIHAGYYINRKGLKRDIRDIDYLAIANIFGERNPSVVTEWSDTFLAINIPLEIRLRNRWNIIMTATNESAVLTGFYHRVTFANPFLDALARAAKNCGLSMRLSVNNYEFNNRRGNGLPWIQTALNQQNDASIFHRGFSNTNSFGFAPNNFRY